MNPRYGVADAVRPALGRGLVDRLGPRGWWIARFVLVVVSLVALVSFGAQLVLAPVLVPALWSAARRSGASGRNVFATLAALLVGEFGWMIGYVAANETTAALIGMAAAAGTGVLIVIMARRAQSSSEATDTLS